MFLLSSDLFEPVRYRQLWMCLHVYLSTGGVSVCVQGPLRLCRTFFPIYLSVLSSSPYPHTSCIDGDAVLFVPPELRVRSRKRGRRHSLSPIHRCQSTNLSGFWAFVCLSHLFRLSQGTLPLTCPHLHTPHRCKYPLSRCVRMSWDVQIRACLSLGLVAVVVVECVLLSAL